MTTGCNWASVVLLIIVEGSLKCRAFLLIQSQKNQREPTFPNALTRFYITLCGCTGFKGLSFLECEFCEKKYTCLYAVDEALLKGNQYNNHKMGDYRIWGTGESVVITSIYWWRWERNPSSQDSFC